MDSKSQEIFNAILDKTPESLTEDDKKFLRARRSYLKPADEERFESILNPVVVKQEKKTKK